MRDDAVAPVIAVMLVLAAAATALAVLNGVYIPSLKEAADAGHLGNVESSFQQFSSDIGQAVALRKNSLVLSEPVPLGGGDVFLSPARSSGTLAVTGGKKPAYYLMLDTGDGLVLQNGTMVSISYDPVGNFWQDQGYRWQYGFVNVTKYGKKQAPLGYSSMAEVCEGMSGSGPLGAFAGSFGEARYTLNQTYFQNMSPTMDNRFVFAPRPGTCSSLVLTAVNFSASPEHGFASGNGYGKLELRTKTSSREYSNVRSITVVSDNSPFGNATAKAWNGSFSTLASACSNTVSFNPDTEYSGSGFSTYFLSREAGPVNVTLTAVNIEIGAR